MTINIWTTDPECTADLRAFTEFRIFSALSRYGEGISVVDVHIRRLTRPQVSQWWTCVVALSDDAGGRHSSRGIGRFFAESVERAADRASMMAERIVSGVRRGR